MASTNYRYNLIMSASVKKFIPRSPRYTLKPNDDRYIRFAHQEDKDNAYTTQFIDISMSGLAFVINREQAPFLFDLIKIEIPLGNGEQIAWWAKVVRVEEYSKDKWYLKKDNFDDESKVLVAVHFHDLPLGHIHKIKENLRKKFDKLQKERKKERLQNFSFLIRNHWTKLFIYFVCCVFTIAALWALSRPADNYDGSKGAPWGERFQLSNIFSD